MILAFQWTIDFNQFLGKIADSTWFGWFAAPCHNHNIADCIELNVSQCVCVVCVLRMEGHCQRSSTGQWRLPGHSVHGQHIRPLQHRTPATSYTSCTSLLLLSSSSIVVAVRCMLEVVCNQTSVLWYRWLGVRKSIHPEWRGASVISEITTLASRHQRYAYCPADAAPTPVLLTLLKSRMVLRFCWRPTYVFLEKRRLNRYCWCMCMQVCAAGILWLNTLIVWSGFWCEDYHRWQLCRYFWLFEWVRVSDFLIAHQHII